MDIFEAFDNLVLLQKGGRLTYFGPLGTESSALVAYLEAQPGVEAIKPGYNPATWMLEVTGGSMSTTFASAGHDFPQLYAVRASLRSLLLAGWRRRPACLRCGRRSHVPPHLRPCSPSCSPAPRRRRPAS